MKAVIQRVKSANVKIAGDIVGEIGKGFLVLIGIGQDDTMEDAEYMVKKTLALRVFSDENGKMNKSVTDVNGELMLVSQFTLLADTKKGNRPSFTGAMHPSESQPLFDEIVHMFKAAYAKIATGEFGADMQVSLINDGPVTILLDTKNRKR